MDRYYLSDCQKIQKVFKDNGILISLEKAYEIWSERSNSMAAGWLQFPETEEALYEEAMMYAGDVEKEQILEELKNFMDTRVPEENRERAEWIMEQFKKIL